jgi:hypothetical protein
MNVLQKHFASMGLILKECPQRFGAVMEEVSNFSLSKEILGLSPSFSYFISPLPC